MVIRTIPTIKLPAGVVPTPQAGTSQDTLKKMKERKEKSKFFFEFVVLGLIIILSISGLAYLAYTRGEDATALADAFIKYKEASMPKEYCYPLEELTIDK